MAKYCLLASSGSPAIREFRIQFLLNMSETFVKSASLIQWTEQFVRAFEAASEIATKASSVKPAARFAISEVDRVS